MQQLISVIGSKGGTGKTSISHMLCHGLGLLGRHSISILTDIEREPLSRVGRHYITHPMMQLHSCGRLTNDGVPEGQRFSHHSSNRKMSSDGLA